MTEEVRAHCERSYEKAETPEVQAEGIWRQTVSGDRRVALQRRRVMITVDKVLRARGKMLDRILSGLLVRQAVQWIVPGPRCMESSSPRFPEET